MSTVSTNSSSAGVGPSSSAAAGARVAEELKAQYDELQNLRREFAILQQIQGDFTTDVKGFLGNVREQAGRVRTLATAEVPAERAFIVAGKARLDGGSQEVLTLVEDLQDTVDDLKLDVIQRGVKPKPGQLKSINADIERATKGLEEVEKYVQTVKPSWKKTWEAELQNIVDEQEFLNHQEGLISDLRDDHAALQEVFANIQQVVKLRGTTGPGARGVVGSAGRNFVVPPPDEGHEGLNTVMMEVKGLQVDSSARLRALAQAEKQRERELAARTDELQQELVAGGKGLKKTGGYSEAERQRERRNEATLKAMFAGVG